MARQIYVNLAVADLDRSVKFFAALGFDFEPAFTNDDAACMIVGENIYVMLLVNRFFQTFTEKDLCDTMKSTEVLVCLSCESLEEVDELVSRAAEAGASVPREPQEDGFMYGHGFEDLDGHIWELIFIDSGGPDLNGSGSH